MIDFDTLLRINKYAEEHTNSSFEFYSNRTSNLDKTVAFQHCLKGKIAEFNLYYYLIERGYELNPPDLAIYSHHKKTYESDLYVPKSDTYLHVKSIGFSSQKKYGLSIVFEKKDPLVSNPKSNHYIVPMIEMSFLEYRVHSFINAPNASFAPTITPQSTKCAIYLD